MDWLNRQVGLRLERIARNKSARSGAAQEMLLVRRFVVGVAGRKHHAFDAQCHHFVKEGAHAVRVGAIE